MSEPAQVIVADPPWPSSGGTGGNSPGWNYPLLTMSEIMRFPLPPLAENAVLFLWRLTSMVPEAYDVVKAWGFAARGELIWLKRSVNGYRHCGFGCTTRNEHETVVIAIKGRPTRLAKNVLSSFEATIGRHSEKPDAFYSIVESMYPGPYVELFSRRTRPGWQCFGNELPEAP